MSRRTRDRVSAESSARDPISRWLDVFVPLLRLPRAEAGRIRDELEDHLRTRVDDLLILGMSEPEAVQKAVTELGETARLARSFRSVRTSSRGRIAMYTGLFVVAGLALTVGVAGILPRPQSVPSREVLAAASAQPEAAAEKTLGVDLPEGTLEGTLTTIAEATGARLYVHWSAFEGSSGIGRETEVGAIPAKNLHGSKIREILNSMLGLSGPQALAVRVEGDLLEVAPRDYFDRIEMVTREYDLTSLLGEWPPLEITTEAGALRDGLREMVEPELWTDGNGAIVIHGSLMAVRAPERVQGMVAEYIDRIKARFEANQKTQRDRNAQRHSRVMESLPKLEAQLDRETAELEAVRVELWKSEYRRQDLEEAFRSAQDEAVRSARLDELARASADHESIVQKRDLLTDAINRTRLGIQHTQGEIGFIRALLEPGEAASR